MATESFIYKNFIRVSMPPHPYSNGTLTNK